MSNIIKIKRGSSVPSGSDLEHYELGYRTGTNELYINDGGTYTQVGGGGNSTATSSFLTGDSLVSYDGYIMTRGIVNENETGSSPAAITFGNGATYANDNISLITSGAKRLYINSSGVVSIPGSLTLGTALAVAEGGTGATSAHNARINLGLGALAELSQVDAATIADNSVGADELDVSGNGTNGQYLASDGSGGFNWLSFVSSNNASTLDNLDSTQFLRSDANDTATGQITISNNGGLFNLVGTNHAYIQYFPDGTGNGRKAYVGFGSSSNDQFTIANESSDQDMKFIVNDGGSNVTAIRIDASDNAKVRLPNDSQHLSIGAGDDLRIMHNGTNSFISNYTGALFVNNIVQDSDIYFGVNDGGSSITALRIDASDAGTAKFNQDIVLDTNATYLHSTDTSGNKPRMFGMNSSNITYIGPIDSYAGGEIYYGTSSNVGNQRFWVGGTERMRITPSNLTLLPQNQEEGGELALSPGTDPSYTTTFYLDSRQNKFRIHSSGSERFTIATDGTLTLNGTVTGSAIKDEDNMSSNSASHLATQQSIKAYVDNNSGTTNASDLSSGTIPSARIHRPESGDWFDGTPVVGSDGVMEIGRYIDFHNTDTTTNDYDVRLDNSGSNQLDIQTGVGYIRLGPQNEHWSHIYTDRQGHLFDKNLTVLDGKLQSYSGVDLNLRRSQGNADRLLIQSGISTFSQSLHVEKGLSVDPKVHSLNSDARYHVNVLSHRDNTARAGAFIIDTDIARNSNRMSVIHVHGHGYGQHAVIDFKICFYPYSGSNGPDGNSGSIINYSLIDDGNDGRPKFVGINSSGNVAIAIDDYNGGTKYFWHFQVDWYNGTSAVQTPTWSISNSTTDGFGWIQERVLKPPIKQKRESNNVYEICTNGKLAINQDYASEELDVNGVGKFRGDSQGSDVLELGQQTGYSGAEDTQLYTISTFDNAGGIANVGDHLQIQSVRWGQDITFARNGQGGAVPTARFQNGSSSGYMELYKSTNPTSDATYTTEVKLNVNGNSYLTGGNLGIGTSSPSVKTHIKDASNDLYLRLETDKTDGNAQVQYFNDAQQYNLGINNADKFSLWDNTASATRFDIATDGDFKFYGTGSNFESVLSGGATYLLLSGTATQRIEFRNTSNNANGWHGIPSWNTDAWHFYGPTSNGNELAYIYESSRHNYYRGFTVNNGGDDYDFIVKGQSDDNLIRTDAGNDRVGIGTGSPGHKLHLVNTGTQSVLRIDADGNRGANRYALDVQDDDANNRGTARFRHTGASGNPALIIAEGYDHSYIFQSKNTSASDAEQFRIEHFDGNVRINSLRGNLDFYLGSTRMLSVKSDGHLELRNDGSSQGATIQRVGGIQFTWDRDTYGQSNNHAILTNSDNLLINSFDDVTINLDSNNNDNAETFDIRKHATSLTGGTLLFQVDGSGSAYSYGGYGSINGSASNPSYRFNNDSDTGMYRHAADTIGFSTGGSARFTMNGAGVFYASSAIQAGNGGVQIWDGTHGFKTVLAKDSTYTKLLNNDGAVVAYFGDSADGSNYFDNGNHRFRSSGGGTYFGILNSTGLRIGTGATFASYRLDVAGDARITSGSLGVGVAPNSTDGRGDFSNDVVAFSTSDKRLKENIKPLDNALDKVLKISGIEFDWKKLTEKEKKTIHGNEGHDVGVVAQEIEEVLPEVVTTRDTGYKAVKYEKIVPLLIEAIKEQQEQINKLEEKLNG